MLKQFNRLVLIGLVFGLALLIASCAVNPVSGGRELMLMSEDQEIKLGRQTDRQVVSQYGLYEDQQLTDYLNGFCQRLARISHRPNLNYQIKVVDSTAVNAFAVPGGYLYFTRGILAYMNSEAELIGVMGHELGHITARHSAQQYSRAQVAQLGLGLGMILSDTFRSLGDLAQFGTQMLFLKFSRDDERQADDLGVEYATRVGYDAGEMANFFETLERMQPGSDQSGLPGWFSTHPSPVDRRRTVELRAKEWQQTLGVRRPKVNREEYLKRIDGLVYGEDPRQGYIEGGMFYHPELRFQFPVPSNWKVQNTPAFVLMVKEGEAVIRFGFASAGSPREAAEDFVRKNQVSVIESGRGKVKGLPAYRLISQVRSDAGAVRVMSYFIQKDNKTYVFHGFSPASRFKRYHATFENTMQQFRELKDPEKLNVKPDRIRIRATRSGGTLRQALMGLGVPKDKMEEVALLNGRRLDEAIQKNTRLKTISKQK